MPEKKGSRIFARILPDFVFATAAILLAVFYLSIVRHGINARDEWSFIIAVQRMINGDIPFIHDRSSVISSLFFLYPPVKLFYWLNGSYDGIILFIRCLYVTVHTVFSCVIYLFLRRRRWFSVFAAINYFCFVPNEIYSLYYNSISLMSVTLICLLLFTGKEPGKPRLAAAGVALACAVMAMPQLVWAYCIWTAFVFIAALINRKRNVSARALPIYAIPKGWAVVSAGVAACAFCVIAGLLTRTTIPDLLSALPDFLAWARFASQQVFKLSRLREFLRMTGYVPPFVFLFLFIIAAADRQRYHRRAFYLTAASVTLAAVYVAIYAYYLKGGAYVNGRIMYNNFLSVNMRAAPFYLLGFFAFLLTKKKNGRLFTFLAVCASFSVLRDLTSNVVIGLGGAGADIGAALLLSELFQEWRRQISHQDVKRLPRRISALACVLPICFALLSEGAWKYLSRNFALIETTAFHGSSPIDKELTEGPLRGIYTTTKGELIYLNTLKDLLPLRESASSVYIAGTTLFGYLYLDLPCPSDNSGFDLDKAQALLLPFWEKHPEKTPDCIYISLYDMDCLLIDRATAEQLLAFFGESFTFTIEQGKAGYILKNVRPV